MNKKIKTGLLEEYEAKVAYEEEQAELRAKHNIDEDVVVVEKSKAPRVFYKTFLYVVRTCAGLIIAVLACIGLLSLVYPDVRATLLIELIELKNMIFSAGGVLVDFVR